MKVESNPIKCGEIFWYDYGKLMINCDLCLEKFNTGIDAYEHINQHFINDKNLNKDDTDQFECKENIICTEFVAPETENASKINIDEKDHLSDEDDNINDAEQFEFKENIICTEYTAPETRIAPQANAQKTKTMKGIETAPESNIERFDQDNNSSLDEDWFNEKDTKTTNSNVELPTKCKEIRKPTQGIEKRLKWGSYGKWRNPAICDICGKSIIKSNILNHLRTHTNLKEFSCEICNKRFNTIERMKVHAIIHSGKKKYNCDYCGWQFHDQSNLVRHIRKHTGEKPYKCNVCEKSFADTNQCKQHKRTHTGEKSHICDVCKIPVTNRNLHKHRLRHAQIKRYKCTCCDRGFYSSASLRNHTRTHTGERPYPCENCDKSFKCRSAYKQHKILHTGEKPYKCRHCDATFAQGAGRRSHERSVHKDLEKAIK